MFKTDLLNTLERMGVFSIVTFILAFSLGILCFFYIIKILINKRIIIKFMAESLSDAATDKSVIAMVSIVLGILGISFFAICISIYFFSIGV